jgi:hypothetical protein
MSLVLFFKKIENRKVKHVLSGVLVPVGGGRIKGNGLGG